MKYTLTHFKIDGSSDERLEALRQTFGADKVDVAPRYPAPNDGYVLGSVETPVPNLTPEQIQVIGEYVTHQETLED